MTVIYDMLFMRVFVLKHIQIQVLVVESFGIY